MESNNLITRKDRLIGKKSVSVYMTTSEGISFFNTILAPYEKMFPRRRNKGESKPYPMQAELGSVQFAQISKEKRSDLKPIPALYVPVITVL